MTAIAEADPAFMKRGATKGIMLVKYLGEGKHVISENEHDAFSLTAGASTSIEDYAKRITFFMGGHFMTLGGQHLSIDVIIFILFKMSLS